jgi:glycerol kinase
MDVLKAMEADAGIPIRELRVDGGATTNNMLMQFQSDVLNTSVVRPVITETTASGAAFLAGLAVGYWKDLASIETQWQVNQRFEASMQADQRTLLTRQWKRAVNAARFWADDNDH